MKRAEFTVSGGGLARFAGVLFLTGRGQDKTALRKDRSAELLLVHGSAVDKLRNFPLAPMTERLSFFQS